MLVLVLLLVVVALGLLIAALTTANTEWAWISVLISVAAAGLLVWDWVQGRRRRAQAAPATGGPTAEGDARLSSTAAGVPVTDPRSADPPASVGGPEADPEITSVTPRQTLGPQISRLD